MSVMRADLLTRLRAPAKSSIPREPTILITGAACDDMREAAEAIEELRSMHDGAMKEVYRLQGEVARLKKALKKIIQCAS